MSKNLICPICDSPTRVYMGNARKDGLCGKHADMLKANEITINDEGLFIDSKTSKILNKNYSQSNKTFTPFYMNQKKEDAKVFEEVTDNIKENKCIKCIGCSNYVASGNNYLFCYDCYKKFKDKQLLIKITRCVDVEILDESYEGVYKCKDGHIVKSKSEREIDNYLFDHSIPHAYEKVVSIDGDSKHDLHPDFCLPNYLGKGKDVYIEHWGFNSENRDYYKSKKYKIAKYKDLGLTIICTDESDMNDPEATLNRKLKNFEFDKINFNSN